MGTSIHRPDTINKQELQLMQRSRCWRVCSLTCSRLQDTDTLYIEFRAVDVAETKDLDENTILDLDGGGNICGITIKHASERTDISAFSYEQITA